MLEVLLSLLGLSHATSQRAEERKLHAAAILARIDATIMEAALRLDYEIPRLRCVASSALVPPEMAVASLINMRTQCDQIRKMVETNRSLLSSKGANATVIAEPEKWAGTCSVIPVQLALGVQQIELAIAAGVGRQ